MATAVNTIDIIDALQDKLITGDFGTQVGSRVRYGQGRRSETLPYCVFQIIDETTELDTFDRDSFRMRIQISLYESEENGVRVLGDLADDLRALLHRAVLTITGHEPLQMDLEMQRGPLREDDVWVVHCDYILAGWKT